MNRRGKYTVQLQLAVPYTSPRQLAVVLGGLPISVANTIKVRLNQPNAEIKVEPCLSFSAANDAAGNTVVDACCPPTSSISVQWTERAREIVEPVVKEELPLTVTATQSTLHSIGEGFITTSINYDFVIRNGTVSLFDVFLESRVRILSVDGRGMKRWELVEAANPIAGEVKEAKYAPAS